MSSIRILQVVVLPNRALAIAILCLSCLLSPLDSFMVPWPQRIPLSVAPATQWILHSRSSRSSSSSSDTNQREVVWVQGEALFQQNCDSNGLMTKQTLQNLKFVADLLVRALTVVSSFCGTLAPIAVSCSSWLLLLQLNVGPGRINLL
jgi:hypothetical protein